MNIKQISLLAIFLPAIALSSSNTIELKPKQASNPIEQIKQLITKAEKFYDQAIKHNDPEAAIIQTHIKKMKCFIEKSAVLEQKISTLPQTAHIKKPSTKKSKVSKRRRRKAPTIRSIMKQKQSRFKQTITKTQNALRKKNLVLALSHLDDFKDYYLRTDKDRTMFAEIYYHEGTVYAMLKNQWSSYHAFNQHIKYASGKDSSKRKVESALKQIKLYENKYPLMAEHRAATAELEKRIEAYDIFKNNVN